VIGEPLAALRFFPRILHARGFAAFGSMTGGATTTTTRPRGILILGITRFPPQKNSPHQNSFSACSVISHREVDIPGEKPIPGIFGFPPHENSRMGGVLYVELVFAWFWEGLNAEFLGISLSDITLLAERGRRLEVQGISSDQ